MKYPPIHIDYYENKTGGPEIIHGVMNLNAGAKIIDSTIEGPFYLNRFTQVGPRAVVGKYSGMNESCFFARGEMGAYCAIGARTAINPFNHPLSWLAMHEFQYHPKAYDWVAEYNDFVRLERTPDILLIASCGRPESSSMTRNLRSFKGNLPHVMDHVFCVCCIPPINPAKVAFSPVTSSPTR